MVRAQQTCRGTLRLAKCRVRRQLSGQRRLQRIVQRLRDALVIMRRQLRHGEAQLIADNACAHLFVLGEPTNADWRACDLIEERPVITLRGERHIGHGKNVLGDPRVALAWCVNELRTLGITLRAGEVVTTGTCCTPLPIQAGDFFAADFGALGKVSVGLVR